MPTPTTMRLLLLGASGAVGSLVLKQALADSRIGLVVAPTRRPLAPHKKLDNPVVADFTTFNAKASWWACDALICALGTTIRQAGSQDAFAIVDRDIPITAASLARAAGATRIALNSSLGASLKGNFYLRTKAEAEQGIRALNFKSCSLVRPSLIDAERLESRTGERLGLAFASVFKPLIPKRYRAVSAGDIAHTLLEQVIRGEPGVHFIESEEILSAPS